MSAIASPSTLSRRQELGLAALGLGGAGLLWLALAPRGIGLSPDSVGYLAVAKNALAGLGLTTHRAEPLVSQPPLYPLAIAFVAFLFQIAPVAAPALINVALFGFLTYLSGKLAFETTRSAALAFAASLSTLLSVPLLWVALFAWSELLFISLLVSSLWLTCVYARQPSLCALASFSTLAGLASLTRYAGLTLAASNLAILALIHHRQRPALLKSVSLAASISLSPVLFWALRNYAISGSPFGPRVSPSLDFQESVALFSNTIAAWFMLPLFLCQDHFPFLWPLAPGLFIFLLYATYACFSDKRFPLLSLCLFCLAYFAFILLSSTFVAYDPIDSRLLAPAFTPLAIILLFFVARALSPGFERHVPKRLQRVALGAGILAWLTQPALAAATLVLETRADGQGYHGRHWQQGALIRHIARHRDDFAGHPLYANDPEALHFLADLPAAHLPFRVRASWPEEGTAYVLRFDRAYRGDCRELVEKLRTVAEMKLVASFSDGDIYLATRKRSAPGHP